jgi:hypothetical protein
MTRNSTQGGEKILKSSKDAPRRVPIKNLKDFVDLEESVLLSSVTMKDLLVLHKTVLRHIIVQVLRMKMAVLTLEHQIYRSGSTLTEPVCMKI